MSFVEVIARKRDGEALERDEIARFIRGAADGSLPAEQLAALLMAILLKGMDARETRWLVEEMLHSGETWSLAEAVPGVVDKHSTGGVGDTVSLVIAPLLAAVGIPVAMMAGRGLGHTQGTLDKLDAVPGFRSEWDRADAVRLIESCGAAMVAQTASVAPADRTLYALRDVTATVPSLPLIVGSIMSKKLALGASALVLDVKAGSGAFCRSELEAARLAGSLREVAREVGVACEALLTDMSQPLGCALGTACEVRESLALLGGAGDPRLREVTVRLAEEAGVLTGHDRAPLRARLEQALDDGSALAAWQAIVRAHGGDPDPERLAVPRSTVTVPAYRGGVLGAVDGEALGWAAVDLGAGRRTRDERLSHGAGLIVHARLGDAIERTQPLATLLLGEREVEVDAVVRKVRAAFTIGDQPVEPPPLVLGTVDEVAVPV